MKKLIIFSLFLTSVGSYALQGSSYSGGFPPISKQSFHDHFGVRGEMYIMDASGTKMIAVPAEVKEWTPGTTSNQVDSYWMTAAKDIRDVAIHSTWELRDDNSIKVTIQQYDDMTVNHENPKKNKYGNLIKEESMVLENFAPISFVAEATKDHRVVMRYTPYVDRLRDGDSLERIPIGGDRGSFEVMDNQGYLWGDNVRFGGTLAGITCHRGSFVISLYPFPGAKELGSATGKTITLRMTDDLQVKIVSDTEIVPGEMRVKVYGKYLPKLTSGSPHSATSYGTSNLDGLPKEFH